jgi:hypothetical protein
MVTGWIVGGGIVDRRLVGQSSGIRIQPWRMA